MSEVGKFVGWFGGYPRTEVNYPKITIPSVETTEPVTQEKPIISQPVTLQPIASATVYRYQGHDLKGG